MQVLHSLLPPPPPPLMSIISPILGTFRVTNCTQLISALIKLCRAQLQAVCTSLSCIHPSPPLAIQWRLKQRLQSPRPSPTPTTATSRTTLRRYCACVCVCVCVCSAFASTHPPPPPLPMPVQVVQLNQLEMLHGKHLVDEATCASHTPPPSFSSTATSSPRKITTSSF